MVTGGLELGGPALDGGSAQSGLAEGEHFHHGSGRYLTQPLLGLLLSRRLAQER